MSRPSLGLTPEELHERRLQQARDAKRRRAAFLLTLKDGDAKPCASRLCLGFAEEGGTLCAHHAVHKTSKIKQAPCIICGGIAMPSSRLCGYHSEEADERMVETRRKNRAQRNARTNGEEVAA